MHLSTRIPAVLLAGGALLAATAPSSSSSSTPTTASAPAGGAYDVDGGHSGVLFRIGHLGVSYFHGRFNAISGSYVLAAEDPGKSSVTIEIDTASVDTASERRDRHIKSPDFLNVQQYPKATFTSTSVRKKSDEVFAVTGDLSLHGETKEVTVEMTLTGEAETAMGQRSGFEGELTIRRSDFGMTGMLDSLGDEVVLTIFVEGTRAQ